MKRNKRRKKEEEEEEKRKIQKIIFLSLPLARKISPFN